MPSTTRIPARTRERFRRQVVADELGLPVDDARVSATYYERYDTTGRGTHARQAEYHQAAAERCAMSACNLSEKIAEHDRVLADPNASDDEKLCARMNRECAVRSVHHVHGDVRREMNTARRHQRSHRQALRRGDHRPPVVAPRTSTRARGTGARPSVRTSPKAVSGDSGDDPPGEAPAPRLRLWRDNEHGLLSPNLLRLLRDVARTGATS